jgi:peptide/nickel transport system ATP-binding protein
MGVHFQISHKMFIMYAAKGVEYGDSQNVFLRPLHPYTRLLIESLPAIGDKTMRKGVSGGPPSLWDNLVGCRFAPRCPYATDQCFVEEPDLYEYRPGHFAACHLGEQFL